MFFWMDGGMHHMQQFSNMGGGREVTVRQYTAPHAGKRRGMGEPNIFVFNQNRLL
jgi:hypothetical protein